MQVFTPNELAQYNGEDLGKPIYIGIDGDVFDVTRSRRMYGPGGAYHVLYVKTAPSTHLVEGLVESLLLISYHET
jgi:predicted heme/steroid binding protein